jgi:hypothetical protein
MGHFIDLTGMKFGRWQVIKTVLSTNKRDNHVKWQCICDCGTKRIVYGHALRGGWSQSCGCLQKEQLSKRSLTHGLASHPLYDVWSNMVRRCHNEEHPFYKNYGNRGISVCKEWRNTPKHFVEWAMHNGWCADLEIDRINNNGDYKPSNCRFVTIRQNASNRRNNSKYGVGVTKVGNKFRAKARINGCECHFGYFDTATQAKQAREKALKRYE